MGLEREANLEEALLEAERRSRRLLEKILGPKSNIGIVLILDLKNNIKTLIVDIQALRRGVNDINDVVEAAIDEAFKAFEEKIKETSKPLNSDNT
ncbi:MAG: hypothetical protein QXR22_05455 [Acidilobaceae archaeon]